MHEDEKYLFDINGYIVVRDALSPEDIALCNEGIDRHAENIRERTGERTCLRGAHQACVAGDGARAAAGRGEQVCGDSRSTAARAA